MIKIVLIVREIPKGKPDYSLDFSVPELPRVGDYISVQSPDTPAPFGEDVIVRHVWWRLRHPETRAGTTDKERIGGTVSEIMVECDPAISPYSSDSWRREHGARAEEGEIEEFKVKRFVVPHCENHS
jgi:hypothetical protein